MVELYSSNLLKSFSYFFDCCHNFTVATCCSLPFHFFHVAVSWRCSLFRIYPNRASLHSLHSVIYECLSINLSNWSISVRMTYFLSFTFTMLCRLDAVESSSSDDECFLFLVAEPFDDKPTVFTTLLLIFCSEKKNKQTNKQTHKKNCV